MLEAGYLDVAATCEPAPAPTFPTWGAHLRLDYAFVPRVWPQPCAPTALLPTRRRFSLASDHRPIVVELDVAGFRVAPAAKVERVT